MNPLNPLAILSIVNFIVCLIIALTFLIYGKNKLHRTYGCFHLAVCIWAFFVTLACTSNNPTQAYFYWLNSHRVGIYISILFAHSIYQYCGLKYRIFVPLIYFYGLITTFFYTYNDGYLINDGVVLLFTNAYYLDVKNLEFNFLTLPWYILAVWANSMLYIYFKKSEKFGSKTSLILLISGIIGYIGGTSSFIPMFGFHNFYPFTIILISAYGLITSYGVFRHQILEINIIIERGLTYTILLTISSLIYVSLILLSEQLFHDRFGYTSWTIKIIIVFIIAVLFSPLKNKIQKFIDKMIFKGTPFELAEQNQLLRENAVDSEKMRTIATLASGVAHEIRNPLTALKTFVEYFPKKKNDPAFISKFESIASTEINRIESILNELLAFAKPSPLSLTDTDIKKTLEHALNLTANQLGKNKVEVKADFADDLPTIKADTNKLLQVFINLILNATDAMQNGGTLTVLTSVQPPTSSVQISLTDTGCGIEPKDLVKIFEPFFSTKEKGTGLGLAIVKGIIEDHGGKITVKSTKSQGTTFTITLPTTSSRGEATP